MPALTMRVGPTAALCGLLIFVAAGCSSTRPDNTNFKTAIDDYYSAHPNCIWSNPVKFPAQLGASNDPRTKDYDALMEAGLLTRAPKGKKRLKQVEYYISNKGRAVWTPDPFQSGYGNFCFGHREVTSIDHVAMGINPNGGHIAIVNYHFDLTSVPDWAKSKEMQTAFPNVHADLSAPKSAITSLTQTKRNWQVFTG